jgi:hypothetical protein
MRKVTLGLSSKGHLAGCKDSEPQVSSIRPMWDHAA